MSEAKLSIRILRSIGVGIAIFIAGYILVTIFLMMASFVVSDWSVARPMFNWGLFEKFGLYMLRLWLLISIILGQMLYWLEFDD
jgi:hypothetical protein